MIHQDKYQIQDILNVNEVPSLFAGSPYLEGILLLGSPGRNGRDPAGIMSALKQVF